MTDEKIEINIGKDNMIEIKGGKINITLLANEKELMPSFTGSIVRGAFLNYVQSKDMKLSQELHNTNEIRPYSISQLKLTQRKPKTNERNELIIREGDSLQFSVGVLTDDLLQKLTSFFIQDSYPSITLMQKKYPIQSIQYEKIKVSKITYSNKVKIYFHSPTYFSRKDSKNPMLFPDPKYIFMNLLKKWNIYNENLKIPEKKLLEWIDKNVVINDYATFTKRIYPFKKTPILGFLGWVVFRFKDTRMLPWIMILLEFAKISQLGGNRTAGFGEISYKWIYDDERIIVETKSIINNKDKKKEE